MSFNFGGKKDEETFLSFENENYSLRTFEKLTEPSMLGKDIEGIIIGAKFGRYEKPGKKRYGWVQLMCAIENGGYVSRIQTIFRDEDGNPSLSNENDVGKLLSLTMKENSEIENIADFLVGIKLKINMSIQVDYKNHMPVKNQDKEQYLTFVIEDINIKDFVPHKKPETTEKKLFDKREYGENKKVKCTECGEEILAKDFSMHFRKCFEENGGE